MKNLIMKFLVKRWGGGFCDDKFPLKTRFVCGFVQKVLRINKHVPWPIHWTSVIKAPEKIERGTRMPGLSQGCYIDGRNGIRLGDNTWIGPGVKIVSMNHSATDYEQYETSGPVVVGRDCWIASNAVILPGVELGNHTIVAAGAIVNKAFPEGNQLIGGVPARVLKSLPAYKAEKH
tara:strand:+ start:125 stop:652 length:528 start_codon:yes stop_codon:yes gene_type:complete